VVPLVVIIPSQTSEKHSQFRPVGETNFGAKVFEPSEMYWLQNRTVATNISYHATTRRPPACNLYIALMQIRRTFLDYNYKAAINPSRPSNEISNAV